jgi:ParB family chromosome partitioning protein
MTKLDRSKAFSSILDAAKSGQGRGNRELPLSDIHLNPDQPRRAFNAEALQSLSESVKQKGVLQPVLVREQGGAYELVAGERRYRAAQLAGLESIPVTIRELSDQESLEVALIENLQREDLNPVEETDGTLKLLSTALEISETEVLEAIRQSHYRALGRADNNAVINPHIEAVETIFESLGRFTASSFYSHRVPILKMPEMLIGAVRDGKLDYTKARALASVKDDDTRTQLFDRTQEVGLSLKQLREEILKVSLSQQAERSRANEVDWKNVKKKLTSARISKLTSAKQRRLDKLLFEVQELLGD